MNTREISLLKTNGKKVVNAKGEEVILKGVGIGNWLLPEGYMWKFHSKTADRPRRIENLIRGLIGEEKAKSFWERFYDTYIKEADIEQIAKEGFNSIRLPINYRFLMDENNNFHYLEERFKLIDRFIDWCKKWELYVILDLHRAPGGQTGANIDDSEKDFPELFVNETYKELTKDLWIKLVERYGKDDIIAGYDLLNEPLPNYFSEYNGALIEFYRDLIKTIREVDKEHIIILEGAHWSNDWSILAEKFDDNVIFQGHKYWNNPDIESIKPFLDKQEEFNVPIWIGETGENSNEWFYGSFQMLDHNNIGWNFWPWKKLATTNSPCSINKPENWDKIIGYAAEGEKPSQEESDIIFEEYLNNILFENCTYNTEVLSALFRRIPFKIPAEFFGFKGEGISYHSLKEEKESELEFRKSDKIEIEFINKLDKKNIDFWNSKDKELIENQQLSVSLLEGEWVAYEVNNITEGDYKINIHCIGKSDQSQLSLKLNDELVNTIALNGQWDEYIITDKIHIQEGQHALKLQCDKNNVKIHWIDIQ